MLLNKTLQRFHVEPQRSSHLDARKLPEPGLFVDGIHLEAQVLSSLPDVQEPLTDATIRHHGGFCCHPKIPFALPFDVLSFHGRPALTPSGDFKCDLVWPRAALGNELLIVWSSSVTNRDI